MENKGKTIRQIADEIGVSKQAVQKRMRSEPLTTQLSGLSATVAGTIYISVVGEKLIKSAFSSDSNRQPVADNQQPVSDNSTTTVVDNNSVFQTVIDVFNTQLQAKDEQIAELNSRLSEVTSALVSAQESLTAAQALHAGTIQAQLSDGRGSGNSDNTKPSFFNRIFRRKSD